VVEVDHVEGKVVNILRDISPTRIDLVEFKRRYDATFVNEFIPEGEGMRYTLTGSVRLKWPYRLAGPFVKPLVSRGCADMSWSRSRRQQKANVKAREKRACRTHIHQDSHLRCTPSAAASRTPIDWSSRTTVALNRRGSSNGTLCADFSNQPAALPERTGLRNTTSRPLFEFWLGVHPPQ
jgi:hypothetical protein